MASGKTKYCHHINGEAKAFRIRTHEKARADTQRDLIMAIAEGLEKNKDGQFSEPLLLSLSGVLDKSVKDPSDRAYLASYALETLEQLKKLLDEDHLSQSLDSLDEDDGNSRTG